MSQSKDYAVICPVDPRNPFRNPTEEPGYSPDYTEVVPELAVAGASLELFPEYDEKRSLRRFCGCTFLSLMFALFTSLSVYTLLTMLVTAILKQVDLRALGTLPESYSRIAAQYIDATAIGPAINLLAFLSGNLAGCLVCARLTHVRAADCFAPRRRSAARVVYYIVLGLWIQLLADALMRVLIPLLRSGGIRIITGESFSAGGSAVRVIIMGLACCIAAPITEELLLRGFVLKNLSRVSQRTGIFLSAFLFALMHEDLAQFLFAFPLGILLAYITIHHNSLTPAIIVHAAVNTAAFADSLLKVYLPAGTYSAAAQLYALGIAAVGTVCFLYFFATERMPMQTPHQTARSGRIILTTPLLPALIAAHLFAMWLRML